jgi:hypothetical protein
MSNPADVTGKYRRNTPGKVPDMKQALVLLLVCLAMLLVACGQVDTYDQRMRRWRNEADWSLRGAVDDFDLLWLADRPTYLSYWHLREAD